MADAMRTLAFDKPRRSSETEQRHLLSDSISPSESASIITDLVDGDGDRTPRAGSPTRQRETGDTYPRHHSIAAPVSAAYRGFSSEEAYLNALRAWAEDRKYAEPTSTTLVGFYGKTTMSEYAARPAAFQPLGLRKKWKAMKAGRQEDRMKKNEERRATIA